MTGKSAMVQPGAVIGQSMEKSRVFTGAHTYDMVFEPRQCIFSQNRRTDRPCYACMFQIYRSFTILWECAAKKE